MDHPSKASDRWGLRPYTTHPQQFDALARNLDNEPTAEEDVNLQPAAMAGAEALQQTLGLMGQLLQQQQQQVA